MFEVVLAFAVMTGLSAEVASLVPSPAMDRTILAMGTQLRLHLEGTGDLGGASEAALAESARIEAACSTWNPDSAWSRLNAAKGAPVALAEEWLQLLGQLQVWNRLTEGTFDPVLMSLLQAWGTRQGGRTPDQRSLASARQASGSHLLLLDRHHGTARLLHPSAGVEEGGFLKGYALDAMRRKAGVPAGWMDFGGQVMAWGKPLCVEIADPLDRLSARCRLMLTDASLSCSGTSERGRHILDPRRGEPSPAWGSTAVVAGDGLTADVLSTALYVMGPAQGLDWAEQHGFAAAFLLNDGGIQMTSAFRSLKPTFIPQERR